MRRHFVAIAALGTGASRPAFFAASQACQSSP
jgi:hypothetical protein